MDPRLGKNISPGAINFGNYPAIHSIMLHRIAVIADTHNQLPAHVLGDLSSADEIWHLGDVMRPETLDPLKQFAVPLLIIRGNNDSCMDWPLEWTCERGGKSFHLVHIPPRNIPDFDFLLHGHTHVPRDEMIGKTRVLNPGTIGKPNKGAPPSYAWLEIGRPGEVRWRLVRV